MNIYIYIHLLLDDLTDSRGYSHLKEEALDRTVWRNCFGGGFGPVVRQSTEWMDEYIYIYIYTCNWMTLRTGEDTLI